MSSVRTSNGSVGEAFVISRSVENVGGSAETAKPAETKTVIGITHERRRSPSPPIVMACSLGGCTSPTCSAAGLGSWWPLLGKEEPTTNTSRQPSQRRERLSTFVNRGLSGGAVALALGHSPASP